MLLYKYLALQIIEKCGDCIDIMQQVYMGLEAKMEELALILLYLMHCLHECPWLSLILECVMKVHLYLNIYFFPEYTPK